jgi:hypothetical protein
MTERENLLRVIKGEEPAWVPRMGVLVYGLDPDHKPAAVRAMVDLFARKRQPDGTITDIFGVNFEQTESTGGMELPAPGKYLLDDITKWRDVIKVPSLEGIDWEAAAKRATAKIDRNESAVVMSTHSGYFQHLMNFMGFSNGLIALAMEPEEVTELYEYLAKFYETVAKNLIRHIKPDIYAMTDDVATALNPFISPDMYRSLIKPYQVRLANIANEEGIPINMHCCGRCEDFIEDWIEFGVKIWNPAQIMNDLAGIKKKYGNKFVLNGCWDSSGPAGWSGATEDLVRGAVRQCIDTFAPGGGFCFWASVYGPKEDQDVQNRAWWITDEYNKYGRTFYKQ